VTATPPRYAAIDMGTNSTRLLVAEAPDGPGGPLRPLERRMTITRLGQGVNATGRLQTDAVERTLATLRRYRSIMDTLGVEPGRVRATATSAARDAENRSALLGPASQTIGATPEVLTGDAEGRLTYLGATSGLNGVPGPYLVVDIGGGSTEFIVGAATGLGAVPEGVMSIDVGCVRLTEAFLHSDPPAPEELSQAIDVVAAHLDDVERDLPGVPSAKTLIGVAGTVTTVAAVEIGLPEYDPDILHGFHLTRAAAEDVFRTLATEAADDRRHNPGLEAARVDVIVGGAVVLVAVMRRWAFDEMLVSEADILDGLILSQL
jgi:exopolyphosphatase/guanosine-5'-triphosphate,3'-diphosphate pyrophosphatase